MGLEEAAVVAFGTTRADPEDRRRRETRQIAPLHGLAALGNLGGGKVRLAGGASGPARVPDRPGRWVAHTALRTPAVPSWWAGGGGASGAAAPGAERRPGLAGYPAAQPGCPCRSERTRSAPPQRRWRSPDAPSALGRPSPPAPHLDGELGAPGERQAGLPGRPRSEGSPGRQVPRGPLHRCF